MQNFTYCFEGGKSDSSNPVVFDFGEIDVRDTDFFGKFIERYFSFNHHFVEMKNDFTHSCTSSYQAIAIFLKFVGVFEIFGKAKHKYAGNGTCKIEVCMKTGHIVACCDTCHKAYSGYSNKADTDFFQHGDGSFLKRVIGFKDSVYISESKSDKTKNNDSSK